MCYSNIFQSQYILSTWGGCVFKYCSFLSDISVLEPHRFSRSTTIYYFCPFETLIFLILMNATPGIFAIADTKQLDKTRMTFIYCNLTSVNLLSPKYPIVKRNKIRRRTYMKANKNNRADLIILRYIRFYVLCPPKEKMSTGATFSYLTVHIVINCLGKFAGFSPWNYSHGGS